MTKEICEYSGIEINTQYRNISEKEYQELLDLRQQKESWLKVCEYERNKWIDLVSRFPHLLSHDLKNHWKNVNDLLEKK